MPFSEKWSKNDHFPKSCIFRHWYLGKSKKWPKMAKKSLTFVHFWAISRPTFWQVVSGTRVPHPKRAWRVAKTEIFQFCQKVLQKKLKKVGFQKVVFLCKTVRNSKKKVILGSEKWPIFCQKRGKKGVKKSPFFEHFCLVQAEIGIGFDKFQKVSILSRNTIFKLEWKKRVKKDPFLTLFWALFDPFFTLPKGI